MISCCRKKHNAFAILNGIGESKRYVIERFCRNTIRIRTDNPNYYTSIMGYWEPITLEVLEKIQVFSEQIMLNRKQKRERLQRTLKRPCTLFHYRNIILTMLNPQQVKEVLHFNCQLRTGSPITQTVDPNYRPNNSSQKK